MNIDKEWENFISSGYEDDISSDDDTDRQFPQINEDFVSADVSIDFDCSKTPKASDIYISTKTKIAYLNVPIELKDVFWNIPIIPYAKPCNGVIKKQMKFNSSKTEELEFIQEKLQSETYYEENIITSIKNPTGRMLQRKYR